MLFLSFIIVVIAVCVLVGSKLGTAKNGYKLLQEFATQPENAMTLSMNVKLDDMLTNTELDITRTKVENHSVTCIQNSGISLYYTDGAVIMENGKAFEISDLYPDYSLLPGQVAELFKSISFSAKHSSGVVTCQLTAEGDNANRLLKTLLPAQAKNLSDTQKLTIELDFSGEELLSLRFFSEGTLVDTNKTTYTLTAELKPKTIDTSFAVPDTVKKTICSENMKVESSISENLFRLLNAWTVMSQEDSFSADVKLGVDCGPILLDEKMKYGQARVDGNKISCVRKDDIAVYFMEGIFCDQNGVLLTEQNNTLTNRAHLIKLLKQVCMNGEFDCTDTGNNT